MPGVLDTAVAPDDELEGLRSKAAKVGEKVRPVKEDKEEIVEEKKSYKDSEHAKLSVASLLGRAEGLYNESVPSRLSRAENLYNDDRILAAGRILETIDNDELSDDHRQMLGNSRSVLKAVKALDGSPDDGKWTKLGETRGSETRHKTLMYYQCHDTTISVRLETPIQHELLIPILSVINETDLYATWIPNWTTPRFGVKSCTKLQQSGRCSQILALLIDLPWPLSPREFNIQGLGSDDIDETGAIAIKLDTLQTGDEDGLIPPPADGVVRGNLDGGFLIQRFDAVKHERHELDSSEDNFILLSFEAVVDTKGMMLPHSAINFVLRIVVKHVWNMFLKVAEEVRDGKRLQHSAAIVEKRLSIYDWIDHRISAMLGLQTGTMP